MRIKLSAALVSVLALLILAGEAHALRRLEIRGFEAGGAVKRSGRIMFGEPEQLAATKIACDLTLLMTFNRGILKTRGEIIAKVTGIAINQGTPERTNCELAARYEQLRGIVPLSDERRAGRPRELGVGITLYDVTGGRPELWNMVYDSFIGTLPALTGIDWHITGVRLEVRVRAVFEVTCLYEGSIYGVTTVEARGGVLRSEIILAATELRGAGGLCLARLSASGSFLSEPRLSAVLQ